MKIKIYPSLIAADQLNLEREIVQLEPFCDGFHLDVMDNHFVPNLTWGPLMVNAIADFTKKSIFVHIMAENPSAIIKNLRLRPHDIVSFHIESKNELIEVSKIIKEKKSIVSLAISPKTDLEEIFHHLQGCNQILLMSVQPGFSGQSFLKDSIERLKQLHSYRQDYDLTFEIAMDGGINEKNIHELVQNGATSFAVASAVFSKKDRIGALKNLYDIALEG